MQFRSFRFCGRLGSPWIGNVHAETCGFGPFDAASEDAFRAVECWADPSVLEDIQSAGPPSCHSGCPQFRQMSQWAGSPERENIRFKKLMK